MASVTRTKSRSIQSSSDKPPRGYLIALLLIAFVLPFYFYVGGFRLSMYRVYLLISVIPVTVHLVRGATVSICAPDILLVAAAFWMATSLVFNHGIVAQWEFAGILLIETLVPYFVARVMIRNIRDFRVFVWWFFAVVVTLVPFALIENFTGRKILLDLFRGVFSVYDSVDQGQRLGLNRAQVSMPHPILFGVFCAPALALSWYALGSSRARFRRIFRPFAVVLAVFSSLSSGAFLAILVQIFLISWDEVLNKIKKRWVIFAIVFGVIYVFIELASNRNAFQIIASEMTFSRSSGYNRILIFNHSIDDILGNPLFGIGFAEWTRPGWLRGSVDNFWLIVALRYGLVSFVLLAATFLTILYRAGRSQLSGYNSQVRTGYVISMIGIGLAAFTVHIWEATYCLFMFLLGSGVWIGNFNNVQMEESEISSKDSNARKIRYTRFPHQHSPEVKVVFNAAELKRSSFLFPLE